MSLELWWGVVVLLVGEVGAQAIGNRVENAKYPRCHPGVADVAVFNMAAGAPPEPGQEDDPGNDVKHRRQQGEDHLHPHEGEGQFHLYCVLHLEQVEEGPDEGDDEGGDDDEEEEVVVAETKEICPVDCLSWRCASHTDDPENQLNYFDDTLERLEVANIQSNLHGLCILWSKS